MRRSFLSPDTSFSSDGIVFSVNGQARAEVARVSPSFPPPPSNRFFSLTTERSGEELAIFWRFFSVSFLGPELHGKGYTADVLDGCDDSPPLLFSLHCGLCQERREEIIRPFPFFC